jgi:hypothetical protein
MQSQTRIVASVQEKLKCKRRHWLFSSLNLFPLWCEQISDIFFQCDHWGPLNLYLNVRVTPVKVIEDKLQIFTTAASINGINFALSFVLLVRVI